MDGGGYTKGKSSLEGWWGRRWEEPELLKSFLANDFQWVCPASLHFSSALNPTVDTALLEKVQKIVMLSDRAQPCQANVPTKQEL